MDKPSVLIVEDETIIARDLHGQLLALGYAVVGQAATGLQAVQMAHDLQPDLVLMDIKLGPGMDGVAAALAIRAHSPVPIVFLSAYSADDILQRAQLAEPYGYMLKPFSERELATTLQMAFYKQQAEQRERDLRQRSDAILTHMSDGVLTLDPHGQVTSVNPSAAAMFGYRHETMPGLHIGQLLPKFVSAPVTAAQDQKPDLATVLTQIQGAPGEVEGVCQDGRSLPLRMTVSLMPQNGQTHFICIFGDLSATRQTQAQMHSLAFTDELTGLPNRRCLLELLRSAVARAASSQQVGALLFLDLDHFRQANETLGPGFGDAVLRESAQRLQACVRSDDTVAHFGGDEFMVMLGTLAPDATSAARRGVAVSHKILQALSQPFAANGLHYQSSASIGKVLFDQHTSDVDELLKTADAAMYQAKAAGRNTSCFYDPDVQARVLARNALEKDLRRALRAHEFELHYQLQVNAQGVPLGAEALVRWQHPTRGLVMPGAFIAVAEQTRLILPLGQWVLETACQQLTCWAQTLSSSNWIMAVNVSALQFAQTDFVALVTDTLARTGANPQRLELELTESMLVEDLPVVLDKIARIRALGVRLSLDDFGTGYSSLTHLKRVGMDQLKIDQSFVRNIQHDPDDQTIAETIIYLGHNFGMQVIAEGVETESQYQLLTEMGCDAFQGYLFARPVVAAGLPKA